MYISHDLHQRYPYFAWATGTGWRVIDCKADRRTFVSDEYDDKEDALVHVKSLNERYWLEWRAEIDAKIAIRTAREQSAPPPSSSDLALLLLLLKAFLRAILFVKKILGITRNHKSISSQPNKSITKYIEWKRITLEDIDRLWRESGKVEASFREQLSHFANGIESILKNHVPEEYRLNWQSVNQDDIDRQWVVSFSVHPAFGQQLGHFAVGIEKLVKLRNSSH